MDTTAPKSRIRSNDRPLRPDGAWVLYWMTASRRARSNLALQHAADLARALGRPLLVLEALRCDHPWASDRFHRFVLDGMAANARAFEGRAAYLPYVEPRPHAARGLVDRLAGDAAAVVTDDWPGLFLPRMAASVSDRLPIRFDRVDSAGLLPTGDPPRPFSRAYDFRRHLQRSLLDHLVMPVEDPLAGLPKPIPVPAAVLSRWPSADALDLAALPIDHDVRPVALTGGSDAARAALQGFLDRLDGYAERRSHPDDAWTSGLSPWLHWGHLSVHEIWRALTDRESWTPENLGSQRGGAREGFWGMSPDAEAFLDELVTWRELALHTARHDPGHATYETVPAWARASLEKHQHDAREALYPREQLEQALTGDLLWNAAQRQLREEGRIHNALRMLWGKRVLAWTRTPEEAFDTLVALNDRWAVDGRDPNSYAGISWCFGKYDRPWAPERPIYGVVRYMTTASSMRKWRVRHYLSRYGATRAA